MGCIQSKVVGVHRILDDDKHDIHILDGNEEDYYTAFLEDKVLGAGEFGQVKLCIATRGVYKDMQCAVKVIKKGWVFKNNTLLTPLNPEIIRRECKILRDLNGERHTMKLVGLYEGGSEVFIVTEFLAGGEMGDWVVKKETKELRTEDVSRIAYELLDALDFFHSKHIIHRDLKPANIMFSDLSDRATLKVIDFGSGMPSFFVCHVTMHRHFDQFITKQAPTMRSNLITNIIHLLVSSHTRFHGICLP